MYLKWGTFTLHMSETSTEDSFGCMTAYFKALNPYIINYIIIWLNIQNNHTCSRFIYLWCGETELHEI
jgi:hypothetical protein